MKEQIRVTPEGTAVNKRFKQAIEELKLLKKIRGLKTFTRQYDINYGNFYVVLQYPEEHNVKTEHMVYLCRDFGVSPEWLMLGEGSMFKQ